MQSYQPDGTGNESIQDVGGQPTGAEISADPTTPSERVAAAWDALADLAQRRETTEYKPFGEVIGLTFPLSVGRPLDPIYWYCERQGLPPLSVLVVNQATGLPGAGFGRITRERFSSLCTEVFEFDWTTVPNPFAFATARTGGTDPVTRLFQTPDAAEDVYRSVKDRGRGQLLFREVVFRAYGGRCAVSGSEIRAGLEAAHIVPWSVAAPRIRLDVRNGILLTAWHHRLLDVGVLVLKEDYTVGVRTKMGRASEGDQDALKRLDGQRMRVPRRLDHRPDPLLIRQRNELLGHSLDREA